MAIFKQVISLALAAGVLAENRILASPKININPSILDISETGSGCPIGNGGMIHQLQNSTPVFVYMGWDLKLNGSAIPVIPPRNNGTTWSNTSNPDAQDNRIVRGSVAKFCKESVSLGNVPPGYQVHIGQVSVSGFAQLDPETSIGIRVNTRFDREEAGVS